MSKHELALEIAELSFRFGNKVALDDEPTVALDAPSRRDIVEHVHRMSREQNIAVLWSTHLIDEIYDDDKVIILQPGKICADGTVSEVITETGAETIADAFDKIVEKVTV